MDYNEQTDALYVELNSLLSRFIKEFDLNTSTVIGVLEEAKMDLMQSGTFFFELDDQNLEDPPSEEDDLFDL